MQALFAGSVDYAGLFPPAALPMPQAVAAYARHRTAPEAWMLGRFVLPLARFAEFEAAAAPLFEAGDASGTWPLAVLAAPHPERDATALVALEQRFRGAVRAEALELPPLDPLAIEAAAGALPHGMETFFEVPLDAQRDERLDAVVRAGAAAKVRTGGVTPDAFPAVDALAGFVLACARRRLPFKATAGLHHACRGSYRLTYEPDSPSGPMHGFVNLAVAATLAWTGADPDEVTAALAAEEADAFRAGAGVGFRGRELDPEACRRTRTELWRGFGSCSFREPVEELASLIGEATA